MQALAASMVVMTHLFAIPDPTTDCLLALTFDDVRSMAELLVAHGRRADAVTVVTEALEVIEDPRAQLLLARLHLETGTREGAEEAVGILGFWRCGRPSDPEGIALMRCALHRLDRRRDVARLDRDVSWTSTSSRRQTNRAQS